MRRIWCLLISFVLKLSLAIEQVGECVPYTGSECAGVVSYNIFLRPDQTQEDLEKKMNDYKTIVTPVIPDQACETYFISFVCGLIYQPCFTTNDGLILPRSSCERICSDGLSVGGECEWLAETGRNMQRTGTIVIPLPEVDKEDKCQVDIFGGDSVFSSPAPDDKPWFITAFPFLDGFDGEIVFPKEVSVYTDKSTGLSYEVPCFDIRETGIDCIKNERIECQAPRVANTYLDVFDQCMGNACDDDTTEACMADCPAEYADFRGLPRCVQACFDPCPNYAYSDSEYRMMWIFYVTPGSTSIPINIYIVGGFIIGRKRIHKGSRAAVKIAAILALLWAVVDVLPSLFLYTDMVCVSHISLQRGSKLGCQILRGSVHILQCMYYWVAVAVQDLHLAVVKERTMYERNSIMKKAGAIVTVVPLLMMILAYALQVRDPATLDSAADSDGIEYPNRTWNNVKDVFTCTGLFKDIVTEVIVVYIHFVLAGVYIIFLLFQLIKRIIISAVRSGVQVSNRSQKSGRKSIMGKAGNVKKLIEKSGAKKLIYLGALTTILLIFNLLVIATAFPKFEEFDKQTEVLVGCQVTSAVEFQGQPCLDSGTCCDPVSPQSLGIAPNPIILAFGYYFAIAAIPLTFGVIFCGDKKHRDAWKQLFKSNKVLSKASSVMSSRVD